MLSLGNTLSQLAAQKRRWQKLTASVHPLHNGSVANDQTRLVEVNDFGLNPGDLRMLIHVPDRLPEQPALVVVLHGCTQTAEGYDHGAGWSDLADRHGFVVLFAEQRSRNNLNVCFNWFHIGDMKRHRGEPMSIHQMVGHAVRHHGIDKTRIFVTGLSAGGAMTSVMLATYPELFAGGAIIAGLPYGAAHNVQEAFSSMTEGSGRSAQEWGDEVREASPHHGPWPKISVWHGAADRTVAPVNAEEIIAQWTNIHGLPLEPSAHGEIEGNPRRVWKRPQGDDVIEAVLIPGMGHGTPLATTGPHALGNPGPFLLDVGISSTWHIAKSWGLLSAAREIVVPAALREAAAPADEALDIPRPPREPAKPSPAAYAQSVITKALRSAGLLK